MFGLMWYMCDALHDIHFSPSHCCGLLQRSCHSVITCSQRRKVALPPCVYYKCLWYNLLFTIIRWMYALIMPCRHPKCSECTSISERISISECKQNQVFHHFRRIEVAATRRMWESSRTDGPRKNNLTSRHQQHRWVFSHHPHQHFLVPAGFFYSFRGRV